MDAEILVAEQAELAAAFTPRFEADARAAIAIRGCVTLVLPGGSVASTLFPHLAQARIDPERMAFYWGDERAVAPTSPDSNYGLAHRLWLAPARVPAASVHRMPAEASDLALAATRYAAALPALPFDLVLLGVGPDGHVCSLFPGLLPVGAALVAAIEGAPKPPARRLTLTLAALAGARLLVVAAFGALKAPVVHAALRDPDSSLPVARAARAAQRTLFLLDPDAARLL